MTSACRAFLAVMIGFAGFAASSVPASAQQDCPSIRFGRGATSAVVSGSVPAETAKCFTFQAEAGNKATVRVLSGRNVTFSIDGVVEVQDRHTFMTEKKTYRMTVAQLMRAVNAVPFRLSIAIEAPKGQAALGASGATGVPGTDLGPFIGKWTDAPGGLRYCSNNFDGYVISRTTLEDNDSRCRISNLRKDADTYRASLSCDVEGSASRATATFKIINADRIMINGKAYLRCR